MPERHPLPPPHALLAGGGSGGHIFPALAVGEALARRGFRVSFAGRRDGMEGRLVPARGVPFFALAAKPWVGRGLAGKLASLAVLLRSAFAAFRLVRRERVRVVVATGGFAAVPAVVGARLARRPALLVEPNAHAGVANRQLSRIAQAAAVASLAAAEELACPCLLSGVPIRAGFAAVPELAIDPRRPRRLLVLGGSQGARRINRLVPEALAELAAKRPFELAVVHQTGAAELELARAAYAAVGLHEPDFRVVPFVEDVAAALAAADLVISRAGAISLAELAAAGRPSLLLPLELAGAHQVENAERQVAAGAACLVRDADLTPQRLAAELVALLAAPPRLEAMGRAARALARPQAAEAIAERAAALAEAA